MNREQALELARLATAFAEGETLQIYVRQQGCWIDWNRTGIPIGDLDYQWRVKPKAPEPMECWVNVYKSGWLSPHKTAEEAQRDAAPDATRVAVRFREVER